MKKLLIVPALALGLAGCNAANVLQQVQADAKLACAFVPDASMVSAVSSIVGWFAPADAIANYICAGIKVLPVSSRMGAHRGVVGAPTIVVEGKRVLVQGRFVR